MTWTNAIAELSLDDLKNGLEACLHESWPPNLPRFIELCEHCPEDDGSFNRFLRGAPPDSVVEHHTRNQVGFACRTQLKDGEARGLWANTMKENRKLYRAGKLPEIRQQALPAPEPRRRLPEEVRNEELDRTIDRFLEQGIPLLGPYRRRYEEREQVSKRLGAGQGNSTVSAADPTPHQGAGTLD